MNVTRAKEILESPTMIPVTYQGKQIIIQNVNEQEKTARVYFNENREEERTVPVSELVEQ